MEITPLIKPGSQVIGGYSAAGFKINGTLYDGAVIVTPEKACRWDVPAAFSALAPEHFGVFQGLDLDVLLLGTGKRFAFLEIPLKKVLKKQGLNVDVMDSCAACRTYNVLMAEGRRIAAALLPL